MAAWSSSSENLPKDNTCALLLEPDDPFLRILRVHAATVVQHDQVLGLGVSE